MRRITITIMIALAVFIVATPANAADTFRLDTESARSFVQSTDGANLFAAGYLWAVRDRWSADHPEHAECATQIEADTLMRLILSTAKKDYGDSIKLTNAVDIWLTTTCTSDE